NAEIGELLKPVTEKEELMDSYLSDHMVNLTAAQLLNLQNGVESLTPAVRQINVNEHAANLEREDAAQIVDRCESCHLGIREPVKLTAASMSLKGKKPDEYARAFTSHPEPDLLKIHDPEKFGCSPCHQGKWPRDNERRKSSWQLRALAVADFYRARLRSRLPDLPLRRHGPDGQRRRLGCQRGKRPVPPARVRWLPSLRRLRQRA